jgi:tetratricopeptide (TPR) repeat protein
MKTVIIYLFACVAMGCGSAAAPVAKNQSAAPPSSPEKSQTAIAHSTENQTPPGAALAGGKSKWTQGGDPIDTKEFDTAIAAAEVTLKKSPTDETAKKAASVAYYKRGDALTKARQYASALGDYRKAMKFDPTNTEAKEWIDRIISIYDSINRESPKEGEEPPPLPFTKGK